LNIVFLKRERTARGYTLQQSLHMKRPEQTTTQRWLLFAHQLPATPSVLRVRTWRRLQQLGAVPMKQALYVLPDTPEAREDFEWLKTEIEGSGGEASVFSADALDRATDAALVDAFRKLAQSAYTQLTVDLQRAIRSTGKRAAPARMPRTRQVATRFHERMTGIERLDFFSAPGRDRAMALLAGLRTKAEPSARATADASAKAPARGHSNRLWVTRPRPGVDRMASAWLIRRFIDPQARFDFATDARSVPDNAIPFDMFGVEFSHHGSHCTFETLGERFAIREPAVTRLAAIVHDLDLKDDRFKAAETATVAALIEGLQRTSGDDHTLLERGMTMFESLYQSYSHSPVPAKRRATRSTTTRLSRPARRSS
jgi:hypothetical protein